MINIFSGNLTPGLKLAPSTSLYKVSGVRFQWGWGDDEKPFVEFRDRYKECIRMLNGLEKTLERKIPERDRRWQISEQSEGFAVNYEAYL